MSHSRNTGKDTSNKNNQAANSTTPPSFPTLSIKKFPEGFTAKDYDFLCENENARYLPNAKSGRVGHAVFITKPNGEKVAVQYAIPSDQGPQVIPLESIQQITRFGMTRYKATALGKTMYAKRFTHAKYGNAEQESEIDIGYFSETDEGKEPFWGSKEKETPLFRDDLSKKRKSELDDELTEIGLITKCGEELIIEHESVRARDANKVRKPDQNDVMGESARDAYKHFYDMMTDELSPEMKEIFERALKADLKKAFESNYRPEWLHGEGFSLTPTSKNPQRQNNLGSAPKWANTEMMVLERIVKWFALNRPESFLSILPTFEMLFDSELINHIHFEVKIQEKANWVRFIQDINPFVKHHLFRKATDLAQSTAIAYSIIHDVPPVGEPQVITQGTGAVPVQEKKKSLLSIVNPIQEEKKSVSSIVSPTINNAKTPKLATTGLFKNPVSNAVKSIIPKSSFPTYSAHEKSIVQITTTYFEPNYEEPWLDPSRHGCSGSGLVIEINKKIYILTNAHVCENDLRMKVRLANDRKKKYEAKRVCVSYQCDLALLEVTDPEFNKIAQPVEIGEMIELQQEVKTIGFPMGGDEISITKGIVSRIEVGTYSMSGLDMLEVQVDAAINHGNSGGPVFSDGKVVGVAFQGLARGQGIGYMIPTPIIKHFLTEALSGKPYRGFPVLPVHFHILENASLREYYGMTQDQTGIRIASVDKLTDAFKKLKVNDILLEIDSHPVSNEGTVDIPGVGHCINLLHLTHMKYIGDTVELRIRRKNSETSQYEIHNISVVLDHVPFEIEKVPQNEHDKMPTYYFASGICFIPLTRNYLDVGESDLDSMYVWEEGCLLADSSKKNPDEQIVIIAEILDSAATEGYENFKGTIVTAVNNKPINNIYDLIEAFENNKNEMHEVTTFKKSTLIVKNMSAKEHAAFLKNNMIHRDRSDDLLIKSTQNKPDDIIIDNDNEQSISNKPIKLVTKPQLTLKPQIDHTKKQSTSPKTRHVQTELNELRNFTKEKFSGKLKTMSPGTNTFFDKIFELEKRAKNTVNEDLDESLDEDFDDIVDDSEEDSVNEYMHDSFLVSDSEEIEIVDQKPIKTENIESKTKKRSHDAMQGYGKNNLFANSSIKNSKLLNSEDSEELEIPTKRQKR